MSSNSEWEIVEDSIPAYAGGHDPGKMETLFSLGNGHLGMRGDFEEPEPARQRGTYVNGFFEKEPIIYGETAYGFAQNHQTMLNLPDGRLVTLIVDGVEFDMATCRVKHYRRRLDLRRGILEREFVGVLPGGAELELKTTRLVSLAEADLAVLTYSLKFLDGDHDVAVRSDWNLGSKNVKAGHDPRVGAKLSNGWDVLAQDHRTVGTQAGVSLSLLGTRKSKLYLACGVQSVWEGSAVTEADKDGDKLSVHFKARVVKGQTARLVKYLSYGLPQTQAPEGKTALDAVASRLQASASAGADAALAKHTAAWDAFWNQADIVVEGDASLQQALRFNLFHMVQSAGRDGKTNLAAKGLSGEGYEGHYFWDTEIYALPLFTYTSPEVARQLLQYRHSILGAARDHARELDHPGALFPWRTIDGQEASAYFPAGTAQYHINADIIYAARRYALVHRDEEFLYGPLAELAVETARFWRDLGDYIDREDGLTATDLRAGKREVTGKVRQVFCINLVTGPDEYTALVNNNVFTNLMAAENLSWAAYTLQRMQASRPREYADLQKRLSIRDTEAADWLAAAAAMFVPYDAGKKLFPQDDSFFRKAIWDVNAAPLAKRPLLLHYHPLNIYRYQVLKQPDLVLAQFLLGDHFTADEKKRNFAYYEPLTTGDSSLSYCIQSIMAVETGDVAKGWEYFGKTVRMDLDDLHGNARDGIHAAAMAGSWLSMIYGFGGLREHYVQQSGSALPLDIVFQFRPQLPPELKRLKFRLNLGAASVECDADHKAVTYRLLSGSSARFTHGSQDVTLTSQAPQAVCPPLSVGGAR